MAEWETAPSKDGWEAAPMVNPMIRSQGGNIESARETLRTGADFLSGRDPGIDYKTGIPSAAFRAGFSRMSNDAEKANFLNRSVGTDQWGKDEQGAYYIKPEGLKRFGLRSNIPVSIDEQLASRYDLADVAGDAPAIAGGVGAGMAASGLGAVPGALLSGLGAAGGKAVDEIVKRFQGLNLKGPGEQALTLAGEGAMGATGELGARVLAPVARFGLGPGASRMTPEKRALADDAISQGFKIRPGSVTDAPILARWEGMVRNIFGDLYKEQNQKAAEAGVARLTSATPVSKEAAGESLSSSIRALRVRFGEDMAKKYDAIDQMVSDAPIIPTAPLKEQAELLLSKMPKTADDKVIGGKDSILRDIMAMGDAQTVAQAQRMRTLFREASESNDLVPGVDKHEARVLKNALEDAFELAKQPKASRPQDAQAVALLAKVDNEYKNGIRKFDTPVISAITRNASKGGVDADMVVDYLIKPERVVRLRQVKSLVPANEWSKVQAAHSNELLGDVIKGTSDPLAKIFDGKAFRDTLDKYGPEVLKEVHGAQWVDDAYKFANSLMLAEKKMSMSGGIVAANVALHPIQNMPKLLWLRGLAKVMEQPGTFKYLTDGIRLGPNTKEGAAAITRVFTQAAALARDETGSAKFTVTDPQ